MGNCLEGKSYHNFKMCDVQDVEEEQDVLEDVALKRVKYTRSPIMSTYLLAFVVGEFDFVEGKDADGVVIRVYTPKGKAVQGKFALEVSTNLILVSVHMYWAQDMFNNASTDVVENKQKSKVE